MVFFWLTPIILGTFTAAFLAIAGYDRNAHAPRWAAAGYALVCAGSIVDTLRAADNHVLMVAASLLHWAALYAIVRAFLRRKGLRQPHGIVAAIVIPGLAIMMWTGLVDRNANLGMANTNLGGALLLAIGIAMLWPYRRTVVDRLILSLLSVTAISYLARIALFAPMAAGNIEATGTFWSPYNMMFYMSAGLVGLAVAVMLLFALGMDVIDVHDRASNTDALTGIPNRRAFDSDIDAAREGRLALAAAIIIDLDHFKRVNDVHGHEMGDTVLKIAAQTLSRVTASRGRLSRIGGEEFAVLVPEDGRGVQAQLSEDIRASLYALNVEGLADDICISASVGCAEAGHDGIRDAVRRADEAVYAAKREGRNRVRIAPPPPLVAVRAHIA